VGATRRKNFPYQQVMTLLTLLNMTEFERCNEEVDEI
jgi:hypothetical protein